MLDEAKIKVKAHHVLERWLPNKGYIILEEDWSGRFGIADFIIRDDDRLAVVKVEVALDNTSKWDESAEYIKQLEKLQALGDEYIDAIGGAMERHKDNVHVDVIKFIIAGGDKALLCHHVNAFPRVAEVKPKISDPGEDPKLADILRAIDYIQRHGYVFVTRQWSCDAGEAPIIAWKDDTLVFVDVRVFKHQSERNPAKSGPYIDRKIFENVITAYIREADIEPCRVRYDAVSVSENASGNYVCKMHENAMGHL